MFNVRVYGIYINDEDQVLVSDEHIRGKYYTKFPGGGLEQGEGARDCLKREFMEEMNWNIEAGEHIYTTDFYQLSAFDPNDQIISIYYFVKPLEPINFKLVQKPFDFDKMQMDIYKKKLAIETFRFINRSEFSKEMMSFPIDKIVAGLIIERDIEIL
ncbi:MAG: NUDIX domain-containing protein [Ginsengibacter sp.]